MTDLDAQLLQAHENQDHDQLVVLYTQAADEKEALGDVEAACFYLTHAFVFALETGHEQLRTLNERLVAHGREEPL